MKSQDYPPRESPGCIMVIIKFIFLLLVACEARDDYSCKSTVTTYGKDTVKFVRFEPQYSKTYEEILNIQVENTYSAPMYWGDDTLWSETRYSCKPLQ